MQRTFRPVISVLGCLLISVVLGGCGGPKRGGTEVSGTVTLDGAPLPYGLIHLEPETKGQPNAATNIENGNFKFPAENGLLGGKYKVSVKSARPPITEADPNKAMELANQPEPPEKILPKYNSATTLTAEIKPGEPNVLKFDVHTK